MWKNTKERFALAIAFMVGLHCGQIKSAFCQSRLPTEIKSASEQSFRLITPNQFMMGARENREFQKDHSEFNTAGDDRPVHPVILTRPFYMATTEVTVGQFKRFVEATGYKTTAETSGSGIVGFDPLDDEKRDRPVRSFLQDPKYTWMAPGFDQNDSHPVVGVSYRDAKQYCRWLSDQENATYRLPTEAEWECVCRAGTTTPFSFGADYRGIIHRHANLGNVELEKAFPGRVMLQWLVDIENDPDDGNVFTASVGSYEPNPWGLHDLHGNVWEWCEDNYLDTFYRQFNAPGYRKIQPRAIDPLCTERWHESGEWKVIRGGSWFVSPIQCQSGIRSYFEADDAACYVGFRVVREVDETEKAAAVQKHEASVAAAKALDQISRATMEAQSGVIRWEIECDSVQPSQLAVLSDYQYPVEIDLAPPGNLTAELVGQIAKARQLYGVVFRSSGPGIEESTFRPLAQHPELRWVQITGTGDLGDELMEHFSRASELRSVHFQGTEITDDGLSRLPKLDHLESIHLSTTKSSARFLMKHFGAPLSDISFSRVDDDGAAIIAQFPEIRQLNLGASPISKLGLESLSDLRLVNYFSLERNRHLEDEDYQLLSKFNRLERLVLNETNAGDHSVEALRELNHLHSLNLNSENLTNQGLRAVCEIVSLRDLTIGPLATELTEAGLSEFWRLVNLHDLRIGIPRLSSVGVETLRELPELRSLTIQCPDISDDVILELADIKSLKRLRLEGQGDESREETIRRIRESRPGLRVEVQR